MSTAKLEESKFTECRFQGCKQLGIDWSTLRTEFGLELDCLECDLSYSLFESLDLSNSKFIHCTLHEVDFSSCNCKAVSFSESDLLKTRFTKTDLSESDFRKARNYYFDPSQNKCKGARFDYPEVLNLLASFGVKVDSEQ
jgi:uncharacterized protein YjbI with pentapeptide repeats